MVEFNAQYSSSSTLQLYDFGILNGTQCVRSSVRLKLIAWCVLQQESINVVLF